MPQLPRPVEPFARVRRHAINTVQRRSTEPFRQNARPRRTSEDTSCRTPPSPGNPFSHWIFNAASSHFLQQTAERLAHAWHSRRASGPPSPGGTFPARRQITPNRPEKSTKKIFQTLYFSKGSNLSGNCWRLRCAIFCRPDARPTSRESLRPPPSRFARAVRTLDFQNEGRISLRRCAANPGRAGPRPQAASFRGEAVGRPPRPVAQPDRANQRPP